MKKVWLVSILLLTAGCGTTEENNTGGAVGVDEVNLAQLEVEIEAPLTLEQNEETELLAVVRQGEEIVENADEVAFEIWQDGEKSQSAMEEAVFSEEHGGYLASYTFTEEGFYQVQAHTTAQGMHVMPVHEIKVGDPETEEITADSSDSHESYTGEAEEIETMSELFEMEWHTQAEVHAGEAAQLAVHAFWEEDTWENGEIRLEIWQHGDEIREWITLAETVPGEYETEHVFETSGEYHVVVHAEGENIHEHSDYTLEVLNRE